MKHLNAQDYISTAREASQVMYRDDPAQDRLAFHVGYLEGYLIQMVTIINQQMDAIQTIQQQLEELKNESL